MDTLEEAELRGRIAYLEQQLKLQNDHIKALWRGLLRVAEVVAALGERIELRPK